MLSINVNLRRMKAAVEFVWLDGGGGVECYAQSFSCPTQLQCSVEVVLCCVVVGVVAIYRFNYYDSLPC